MTHLLPPPKFEVVLSFTVPCLMGSHGSEVAVVPHAQRPSDVQIRVLNHHLGLSSRLERAIRVIASIPRTFSTGPTTDVHERLLSPGRGTLARDLLSKVELAGIDERSLKKLLEATLDAHELRGHVELTFDPTIAPTEVLDLYSSLVHCANAGSQRQFVSEWMRSHGKGGFIAVGTQYIDTDLFELYALLRENDIWTSFTSDGRIGPASRALREVIDAERGRGSALSLRLLRYFLSHAEGDVHRLANEILKVTSTGETLNATIRAIMTLLNRKADIDDIGDRALEGLHPERGIPPVNRSIAREHGYEAKSGERSAKSRAIDSTFLSITFDDTDSPRELTGNFHSLDPEDFPGIEQTIQIIATVQAARASMGTRNDASLMPVPSGVARNHRILEHLLTGATEPEGRNFIGTLDPSGDMMRFYSAWHDPLVTAWRRIVG